MMTSCTAILHAHTLAHHVLAGARRLKVISTACWPELNDTPTFRMPHLAAPLNQKLTSLRTAAMTLRNALFLAIALAALAISIQASDAVIYDTFLNSTESSTRFGISFSDTVTNAPLRAVVEASGPPMDDDLRRLFLLLDGEDTSVGRNPETNEEEDCGTAFAYSPVENASTCFIDIQFPDDVTDCCTLLAGNRWGWTIGPIVM